MNLYSITEKQNINSARDGYYVEANSLIEAKKIATRNQMFQDTILTVEYLGQLLSAKTGKKWVDVD